MKTIHITHCCKDKNDALRGTDTAVTPDHLYTFPPLLAFIDDCRAKNLEWAIFSDHYGIVFPGDKIGWYSKPPDTVTEEEYGILLENVVTRLADYNRVVFRLRREDSHPLFERILVDALARGLPIEKEQI